MIIYIYCNHISESVAKILEKTKKRLEAHPNWA